MLFPVIIGHLSTSFDNCIELYRTADFTGRCLEYQTPTPNLFSSKIIFTDNESIKVVS